MKIYEEDEFLMLSGIQHFYFCKRQWALIHIEQVWKENEFTAEGQILHEKADIPFLKEKRKDIFISRSMPVSSKVLGLSAILDIVEFKRDEKGVEIAGKKGRWLPKIVEYKRGKKKRDKRDEVQLVAQVICLEESLGVKIDSSDLYYFSTNTRETVEISLELKKEVKDLSAEMHKMYENKKTPPAEYFKNCTLCSLYDLCMPRITKKRRSVVNYLYGV